MTGEAGRKADDQGRTAEEVVLAYLAAMHAVERHWFAPLDEAIRSNAPSRTFPIATELPKAYLEAEAGMLRDLQRVRDRFCTVTAGARTLRPAFTDPPTFDPATTTIGTVVAERDGSVRVETTEGALATPHAYSLVIEGGSWTIDDRIVKPGRGVRSFSSL